MFFYLVKVSSTFVFTQRLYIHIQFIGKAKEIRGLFSKAKWSCCSSSICFFFFFFSVLNLNFKNNVLFIFSRLHFLFRWIIIRHLTFENPNFLEYSKPLNSTYTYLLLIPLFCCVLFLNISFRSD